MKDDDIKLYNSDGNIMPEGYPVNKKIFFFAFIFMLIGLAVVMSFTGVKSNFYFNCPAGGPVCENPFINDPGNCPEGFPCDTLVFLPGTTYGARPPALYNNFGWFVFFVVVSAFVWNHLYFRWRFK